MQTRDTFLKLTPVEGASEYYAAMDNEKNKPAVWMKVPADEHCKEDCHYVISHHKTMEIARTKANQWQQKENRAIEKNK